MDSMGKIARDLRAWARNSGMTVPNEYADRIDALMKEPIDWRFINGVIVPLFAAPPAPAVPTVIREAIESAFEQRPGFMAIIAKANRELNCEAAPEPKEQT